MAKINEFGFEKCNVFARQHNSKQHFSYMKFIGVSREQYWVKPNEDGSFAAFHASEVSKGDIHYTELVMMADDENKRRESHEWEYFIQYDLGTFKTAGLAMAFINKLLNSKEAK